MPALINTFPKSLAARGWRPLVCLAYAALVGAFLWMFAQFYLPGKGFSYLIAFGAHQEGSYISKIRRLDRHVQRDSSGYDAQFYVQIAMDPSLRNRELRGAMDSLSYRARRILFSATAYALGMGQPAAILQVFAVQNAICWLLLAVLLLHWFPPRDWWCFLRWAGVLWSFGLCASVRNALFDGPSLLLIAFGAYLIERGRIWWATGVLAVAGLGKETNLLASTALISLPRNGWRDWGRLMARGMLVVLPLGLWLVYLAINLGQATDPGARNFDWPFVAYFRKWSEVLGGLSDVFWAGPGPMASLLVMVALTVQFLFLATRPQWGNAWWRIGVTFALLMALLGDAVWEGYPGAASRVLLPMQLAFNVLVPLDRHWRIILVLGNLTCLTAPIALESPNENRGYSLVATSSQFAAKDGGTMRVEFSPEWHNPEKGTGKYHVWARANASVTIHNPHARPLLVRLRFEVSPIGPRNLEMRLNGGALWNVNLPEEAKVAASLRHVLLAPGENRLDFVTDQPANIRLPDIRELAYSVHNLRIDVEGFGEVAPTKLP